MNRDAMKKLIANELERIPRGQAGSTQNLLRAAYEEFRLHCLAKDPTQPPKAVFHQAVEQVRKNDPGFRPNVTDSNYFEWSE